MKAWHALTRSCLVHWRKHLSRCPALCFSQLPICCLWGLHLGLSPLGILSPLHTASSLFEKKCPGGFKLVHPILLILSKCTIMDTRDSQIWSLGVHFSPVSHPLDTLPELYPCSSDQFPLPLSREPLSLLWGTFSPGNVCFRLLLPRWLLVPNLGLLTIIITFN